MRQAVISGWVSYSGKLEGVVPWAYLDYLGLVTVAIGNLIDPMAAALALPFVRLLDGEPATREEIAAEWATLKAGDCQHRTGGCGWKGTGKVCFAHQGHLAAKGATKLRLTAGGVSRVVLGKLAQNDADLARRFPDYPDWNADAQFFANSISWACGAGFRFPQLEAALRAQDFVEALKHCHIDESGPDHIQGNADDNWGLKPRNVANKIMLANAAKVQGFHLDPDVLLYEVPDAPLVVPPAEHRQPRQSSADLWEENTGSGGVVHAMPPFPHYDDEPPEAA